MRNLLLSNNLSRVALALAIGLMAMPPPGLAQTPVIGTAGVVNAASGAEAFTVGIAQGSYFLVLGTNLASSTTGLASFPLPTTFGGAQVRVRSAVNNTTYEAPLYFASPTQLNAILPSGVPVGRADLTVTVGAATSAARPILVARSKVGIFTIFNLPGGQALLQNYDSPTELRLNQYLSPARNGQTLILWATGLGPYTAGPDNQPPAAGTITDNVEVLVAGVPIRPVYAGRAPGIPGFDQINFTLPRNVPVPDGCTLPVQIRIGQDLSNLATMAKAGAGGDCVHPLGLPRELLARLDQGGSVSASVIALSRENAVTIPAPNFLSKVVTDKLQAVFSRFNAGTSPLTRGGLGLNIANSGIGLAPGACAKFQVPASGGPVVNQSVDLADPRIFGNDAGNLTVEGGGKSRNLPGEGNGVFREQLGQSTEFPGIPSTGESFLAEGSWTVRGAGGRVFGPFTAQIDFTNLLRIADSDRPALISRSQPVTLRWSGGGNSPEDMLAVTVVGQMMGTSTLTASVCSVPAQAGSFTLPEDMLRDIPEFTPLLFTVVSSPASARTRFSVPLVAGGSVDWAMGGSLFVDQWSAIVQ